MSIEKGAVCYIVGAWAQPANSDQNVFVSGILRTPLLLDPTAPLYIANCFDKYNPNTSRLQGRFVGRDSLLFYKVPHWVYDVAKMRKQPRHAPRIEGMVRTTYFRGKYYSPYSENGVQLLGDWLDGFTIVAAIEMSDIVNSVRIFEPITQFCAVKVLEMLPDSIQRYIDPHGFISSRHRFDLDAIDRRVWHQYAPVVNPYEREISEGRRPPSIKYWGFAASD